MVRDSADMRLGGKGGKENWMSEGYIIARSLSLGGLGYERTGKKMGEEERELDREVSWDRWILFAIDGLRRMGMYFKSHNVVIHYAVFSRCLHISIIFILPNPGANQASQNFKT